MDTTDIIIYKIGPIWSEIKVNSNSIDLKMTRPKVHPIRTRIKWPVCQV